MILIVREPFGDYVRGEEIVIPDVVKAILKSDNASHCIKRED